MVGNLHMRHQRLVSGSTGALPSSWLVSVDPCLSINRVYTSDENDGNHLFRGEDSC